MTMIGKRLKRRLSLALFNFSNAWKADLFPEGNVCIQKSDRIGLVQFHIGPHSYANGLRVYGWQKGTIATVGDYCSIAEDVVFLAGGEHDYSCVSSSPFFASCLGFQRINSKGAICVGSDVWIGHGAILLSGLIVGDGAIIAAGAVVTKDVAPYSIVGGIPARLIKYRFDTRICQALLRIRWWDWDEQTVRARAADFSDVQGFVQKYDLHGMCEAT